MAGRGGKTSTTWKKGQNPTMPKGTKQKKTVLKESIGLKNWDQLKSFIEKEGAEKLVTEISKLNGKDYVIAYGMLAEYVKPKLNRVTLEGNPDKPIQVNTQLANLSFEQLYQLKYGKKPE